MKSHEARDLGRATGSFLRDVTAAIRGAHFAVSDTTHDLVHRALGPGVLPVKAVHDTVASGVYAAAGIGIDVGSRAAGFASSLHLRQRDEVRPSLHDGRGAAALGASLGIRGDQVAATAPALTQPMHVRLKGRRVELTRESLAAAYPTATGELVVLLHGLCQTESAWLPKDPTRAPYAARLAADLGLTPVTLRYNTGLRIPSNGAALDALLQDLVAGWPVPVERIVLVGFSMGGLVVHSALASVLPESPWVGLVSDTVTIGSPHHGAPFARGTARASRRLADTARGRWAADFLERRSVGIRDLEHGTLVDGGWTADAGHAIRHHAVAGVLSRRLPSGVSHRIGDILVPVASAHHADTATVRTRFAPGRVATVRGVHHIAMMTNDEVYEHLKRMCTPAGGSLT